MSSAEALKPWISGIRTSTQGHAVSAARRFCTICSLPMPVKRRWISLSWCLQSMISSSSRGNSSGSRAAVPFVSIAVPMPRCRSSVSAALSGANWQVHSPPVNVTPPPSKNIARQRSASSASASTDTPVPPACGIPSGFAHHGQARSQPCKWYTRRLPRPSCA